MTSDNDVDVHVVVTGATHRVPALVTLRLTEAKLVAVTSLDNPQRTTDELLAVDWPITVGQPLRVMVGGPNEGDDPRWRSYPRVLAVSERPRWHG